MLWKLIPWHSNVEEVTLFTPSYDDSVQSGTFCFHEVDLDRVKNPDHYEHDNEDEGADRFAATKLRELKRHTKILEEKLATRKKDGGRNADLDVRSCDSPFNPHGPILWRHSGFHRTDLVVYGRTISRSLF
jgi:hypothetical protein